MDAMAQMDAFFAGKPRQWALCETLRRALLKAWPGTQIRVKKTCVCFDDAKPYCYVSLPKKKAAVPAIVVTFGLKRRLDDERIAMSVEAAPGRSTHHVEITNEAQVDDQLLSWIEEGRHAKGRR